jgi:hypothetical protein
MAKHILQPAPDGSMFIPGNWAQPGDILQLPPTGSYLYPGTLQGTPDNPIRIISHNDGQAASVLTAGIVVEHGQHVIIDGGPEKRIIVDSGISQRDLIPDGTAFKVEGRSRAVTIRNCRTANCGYAAWVKNESNCDDTVNDWLLSNIEISNCEFKNSRWQHIYAGSTDSDGTRKPLFCGGQNVFKAPGRLSDIRILDNLFEDSGRAAVQLSLSSGPVMSQILRNTIKRCGLERSGEQGNGINIGGLARVRVANNSIDRTYVAGIAATGAMEIELEDNDINNSGWLDDNSPIIWAWGIWVATRKQNLIEKMRFKIKNNRIGKRGLGGPFDNGWHDMIVGEDDVPAGTGFHAGNEISGNISTLTNQAATLKITPGISYTMGNTVRVTPLHALTPAVVVATVNIGFVAAGITAANTQTIFEVGNPLKSYDPTRPFNPITGFEAGKGYYVVPKLNFDLSNMLYPPIPPGSLLTATKLKSSITKIMKQAEVK